jgi:hypothetical protein
MHYEIKAQAGDIILMDNFDNGDVVLMIKRGGRTEIHELRERVANSGLLACPTCGTQPETRGWQTYCPKCLLEAPPGEVPAECEANWNKMISG